MHSIRVSLIFNSITNHFHGLGKPIAILKARIAVANVSVLIKLLLSVCMHVN